MHSLLDNSLTNQLTVSQVMVSNSKSTFFYLTPNNVSPFYSWKYAKNVETKI